MSKKLKTDQIASELEGSAFFGGSRRAQEAPPPPPIEPRTSSVPREQSPDRSTSQSLRRPAARSTTRSTSRSTDQSTAARGTKYVDRPKAFYITERLDARLDEAVRYFQDRHGLLKVDRSTVVNAILDNEAQWTEESLDLLIDRLIGQLTSRLTRR